MSQTDKTKQDKPKVDKEALTASVKEKEKILKDKKIVRK